MYTKAVEEKLSIMTELLIIILNCDYSEAYDIIVKSQTYQSKSVDTVNTVETAFRELKEGRH